MSLQSRLNQTSTIQTQSTSQSTTGGVISTWTNVNTLACFVSDMPEQDKIIYGKFDGTLKKDFIFNVDPQASIADRIVWNNITFDILFVQNLATQNRVYLIRAESLPTNSTVVI
jgi:hypothetical protein